MPTRKAPAPESLQVNGNTAANPDRSPISSTLERCEHGMEGGCWSCRALSRMRERGVL